MNASGLQVVFSQHNKHADMMYKINNSLTFQRLYNQHRELYTWENKHELINK